MNNSDKEYIGTYKVVKLFRVSSRRIILAKGLTRVEAIDLVNSYPDSSTSMVVFEKQFTQDKYFK